MPIIGKKYPHRYHGQAAVEFALILPLLLLVVYGLIEVGRAMFIYSSVTNASREASRYGSAYGVNAAGVPRYQDCAGIRETARRTGFYLSLPDEAIVIAYDTGIDPDPFNPGEYLTPVEVGTCDPGDDVNEELVLECGDRIVVTITQTYSPILSFLPLEPQAIVSSSARTFVGIITLDEDFTCED